MAGHHACLILCRSHPRGHEHSRSHISDIPEWQSCRRRGGNACKWIILLIPNTVSYYFFSDAFILYRQTNEKKNWGAPRSATVTYTCTRAHTEIHTHPHTCTHQLWAEEVFKPGACKISPITLIINLFNFRSDKNHYPVNIYAHWWQYVGARRLGTLGAHRCLCFRSDTLRSELLGRLTGSDYLSPLRSSVSASSWNTYLLACWQLF